MWGRMPESGNFREKKFIRLTVPEGIAQFSGEDVEVGACR